MVLQGLVAEFEDGKEGQIRALTAAFDTEDRAPQKREQARTEESAPGAQSEEGQRVAEGKGGAERKTRPDRVSKWADLDL